MNALKIDYKAEQVIEVFEGIWEWNIDLNSWVGLHFIQWCRERNYKNASFYKFVRNLKVNGSRSLLDELERLGYKYRTFAKKYLTADEEQPFLKWVSQAHHEHFGSQEVKGVEL
ncbi:hypothetical protein [Priestia flexa]|uniref:hypothetical protein n=1 Tax=Priestia flexa TaxID=86664 RepID=UPI002490847D|nr:hypothetical protein [Priestia flexa]